MLKKKLISVAIAALVLFSALPAYAAMPDGSLDKIAITLNEGQVKTFRLPDLPSSFTDTYQWINDTTVTTTQNSYVPSMWFKIYVSSDNQEIEWTLSGDSSSTFTDYISVVITHESDLNTSRCYGFWQVTKNATIIERITKSGYAYIHLYGKDVTTDFNFSFTLRDYTPAIVEPKNSDASNTKLEISSKDKMYSTPSLTHSKSLAQAPMPESEVSSCTDEPIATSESDDLGMISAHAMEEYAAEVFRLTNIERKKAGLAPLKSKDALSAAAMHRATELIQFYSHNRPDGSKCFSVFTEFGIKSSYRGENIAKERKSSETVVQAWMKSTAHRSIMLNKNFKYMGIGVAVDEKGKLLWVQLFAK